MEDKNAVKQSSGSLKYEGFWGMSCMALGLAQVVVGVMSMIMNGIGIYFHAHMHNYAQGIWCGSIFLITGFCAVLAGHLKNPIVVKITFVMVIVSAVFSIPMMGITAAGMDFDRKQGFNYWVKDPYTGIDYLDGKNDTRKAAHGLLLFLSLFELLLAVLNILICVHGIFFCNVYNEANNTSVHIKCDPKSDGIYHINMTSSAPVAVAVYTEEITLSPANQPVNNYAMPPANDDPAQKKYSQYPSQSSWDPHKSKPRESGGPPVVTGGVGSSAFLPLHSIQPDHNRSPPHGSHNTSSSSFTPLHMIQPDHNYNPQPSYGPSHGGVYPGNRHHNMSSGSDMYHPKKSSSSRSSSTATGGYAGGSHDHSGSGMGSHHHHYGGGGGGGGKHRRM